MVRVERIPNWDGFRVIRDGVLIFEIGRHEAITRQYDRTIAEDVREALRAVL